MRRHRSQRDRANRDFAAFTVVIGITALMTWAAAVMQSQGVPESRQWVVMGIAAGLGVAALAWLAWRYREYKRQL